MALPNIPEVQKKNNSYTTVSIKDHTHKRLKRNIPFKLTFDEFFTILCFNIEKNIIDIQVFDPHQLDDKDDQEVSE